MMWRLWTRGWGPRAWWYWFVREGFPIWVAWRIPSRIAYWAFIRVYSKNVNQDAGPEYEQVAKHWAKEYRL